MKQSSLWSLVAATAVGLFGLAGAASTGEAKAAKAKAKATFQSPYSQIILELRAAQHWLKEANHDYNGHRAKAEAEVASAIRHLEEHPKHKLHAKEIHNHKPAIHEPQKISDAQMVLAHKLVKDAGTMLAAVTKDKYHAKIVTHLQDADRHIGMGLAFIANKK